VELTRRERSILTWLAILLVAFLAIEVAMLVLGALAHVVDVILIFLVAWAVAYMLVPLVDLIDRRTPLDRWGAVLIVYLAVALLLAATLALIVPVLASQLVTLVDRAPEYGDRAARVVVDWQAQLDRIGFRVDVAGLYGTLPGRVGEIMGAIAADALGLVAATGALLFNVTLVLIIAFIMLIDGDALWRRFTTLLSEELRSEAELFRQSADRSFGGFVRASLLLGLVYGVVTLAILVPFGVPFAALLALVAGLVMIIPFFGPVIAMIPIAVVTLLGKPDALLPVFVLSLALQQVMLNVVGPRLMANVIGIHPLFVFLAILLGARLAGFWGVLLAMPIAGIANIFARYVFEVTQGRRARTEAARLIGGGSSAPEDIRATGR